MTTSSKRQLGTWARLSSKVYQDPAFLDCSRDARLVFLTGIAIAKDLNADGVVPLRVLIGAHYGCVEPHEVELACAELVDRGLWVFEGSGTYRVRSYLKWNESTTDQDEARERRRIGAHRTNHRRGLHVDPVIDCPDCEAEVENGSTVESDGSRLDPSSDPTPNTNDNHVSPGQCPIDHSAIAPLGAHAIATQTETERQTETIASGLTPDADTRLAVAQQLCEHLAQSMTLRPANSKKGSHTKAWDTEMERMIRLDDRDPTEIRSVIDWLYTDPARNAMFWSKNVRCPKKLREQFDVLRANRIEDGHITGADKVPNEQLDRFCEYFYEQLNPPRPLAEIRAAGSWDVEWATPAKALLGTEDRSHLRALIDHLYSGECFLARSVSSPAGFRRKLDRIAESLNAAEANTNRQQTNDPFTVADAAYQQAQNAPDPVAEAERILADRHETLEALKRAWPHMSNDYQPTRRQAYDDALAVIRRETLAANAHNDRCCGGTGLIEHPDGTINQCLGPAHSNRMTPA